MTDKKEKSKGELIDELNELKEDHGLLKAAFDNYINENSRLIEELRKSRNFLQNTFNAIQDGISVQDKDLNIILANQWMEKKYTHQLPLAGKKCYYVYHQRSSPCPSCPVVQVIGNGESHSSIVTYPSAENYNVWMEQTALPVKNEQGEVYCVIEYSKDISRFKNAERSLKNKRRRLSDILEGTQVATWEWNIQTGETVFNERWAEFIGYTLEEISPVSIDTWYKFTYTEDLKASAELLEKHFKNELDYYECEARMKHKNGYWVWVLDRGKVHKWDENGKPLLMSGTHQNITRHKETEKKLHKLNADKDRFISILAHDLRSPFNVLLGFTEILTNKIHEYDINKVEVYLNHIKKAAQNTNNLLEDLLKWAGVQQGKINFNPEELIFTDIYKDIIEILKPSADAKHITINFNAPDHLNFCADTGMIKTVIRNLVSNAIKFTDRNGEINIKAKKNPENVLVSVSDNGIGIAPDNLAKLFDISKVDSTKGTAGETGTGMGLLICKEFVTKHGGEIRAESTEGEGSVFYFTIPDFIADSEGETFT